MRIKVCGITDVEQAKAIEQMDFHFCGFIMYDQSPRYVLNFLSLEKIKEITHPRKVGVFVNENPNKILELADKVGFNFIQLHGNEPVEDVKFLNEKISVIKAFQVDDDVQKVQNEIDKYKNAATFFLFDTKTKNYGGSGKSFQWGIIDQLKFDKPYILSGGISLENAENFKALKNLPYAIDVNSKFEISPGIKDLDKLKKLKNKL